jgi:RimJ/RimL family protein N-acetyltransferase
MHAAAAATIAPLALEHAAGFHRAVDMVARERKYLALLEAFPLPQTRDFVLDDIKNSNPQFVALVEGEVIGWCDIRRHYFPSRAHRGTLGMGIIPAYRGGGLGTRLIRATLEAAFAAGFVRVELDVHADNVRAIALYEKVGFAREGLLRDAVYVDGAYQDSITMTLIRQPAQHTDARD